MLKGKLDTSTKSKDDTNCDVDLEITENGRNESKIIVERFQDYFNSLTKHMSYEDKKIILNGILSDT